MPLALIRKPALLHEVVVVVVHADETCSVEVVSRYADASVRHAIEAVGLSRDLAGLKACLVAQQIGAARVVLPPNGPAKVRRR